MILTVITAVAGLAALPADIAGRTGAADYNAFLQRAAMADHARTQPGCPRQAYRWLGRERRGGDDIPQPLVAASATRDLVVEHVVVSGCGRTQRHNLMVWRTAAGRLDVAPLATGDSLAPPSLQDAAFSAAVRLAVGLTPQPPCPAGQRLTRSITFGDVTIVRRPTRPGRPWSERIPVSYCGLARPLIVTYTPRRGGLDWDIQPAWPGARR
jgi:hypothetical protein